MVKLLERLLDVFLDVLDLLQFVLVLDLLVGGLLLAGRDLVGDWLSELVPLFFELLEFLANSADITLQHLHVLISQHF